VAVVQRNLVADGGVTLRQAAVVLRLLASVIDEEECDFTAACVRKQTHLQSASPCSSRRVVGLHVLLLRSFKSCCISIVLYAESVSRQRWCVVDAVERVVDDGLQLVRHGAEVAGNSVEEALVTEARHRDIRDFLQSRSSDRSDHC
jgi:hypothetical protein